MNYLETVKQTEKIEGIFELIPGRTGDPSQVFMKKKTPKISWVIPEGSSEYIISNSWITGAKPKVIFGEIQTIISLKKNWQIFWIPKGNPRRIPERISASLWKKILKLHIFKKHLKEFPEKICRRSKWKISRGIFEKKNSKKNF